MRLARSFWNRLACPEGVSVTSIVRMNGAASMRETTTGRSQRALSFVLPSLLVIPMLHCAMHDTTSIDFITTSGGPKKTPKPCFSDGECTPPAPYCDVTTSTCIECRGDANCTGAKKFCGPGGACVACVADQNCAKPKPYCDVERFACVECMSDAPCEAPKVCDSSERRCVPSCTDSSICEPMKPYCDSTRRFCVECLADGNCADAKKPACGPLAACVECTSGAHCPLDRPLCDVTNNKCIGCVSDLDCPVGKKCDPMQHCAP